MMNEIAATTANSASPPLPAQGARVRATPHLALLAAFIVAAATIHAGIVAGYANPIPFSDEWIALIDNLLRPSANGTLSLLDFFRPHNEHTIVPTRLLGYWLIALNNGQFDNVPSALLNALFYALAMAVPLHLFMRGGSAGRAIAIAFGLAALAPIEGEDLIFGFQNQYYFLIAGSVALLWFAATATSARRSSLVAFGLVALVTCLSMGSGFAAAGVSMIVLALRLRGDPALRSAVRPRLAIGAGVTVLGLLLAFNAFLVMKQVGNLGPRHLDLDGIRRIFSCLAWPYVSSAWVGFVVSLPLGVFALRILLRPRSVRTHDWFALGLALWVGAQICALAYDRDSEATRLASRYLPVLLFWPAMNVYALLRLCHDAAARAAPRAALALALLPLLAAGAFVSNVVKLVPGSLAAMAAASQQHRLQAEHIARYVRVGDRDALYNAGHMGLPYSNTQKLQALLDDPAVRSGLPANVRATLPVAAAAGTTGFVPHGAYDTVPRRDDLPGFGSREGGDAVVGEFRSEVLQSNFPYLRLDLSGYLPEDPGLALRFDCVAADCRPSEVRPAEPAHESWRGIWVKIPAPQFRIVAEDHSTARWLAFSGPLEAGRLSVLCDALIDRLRGDAWICIALAAGLLAILVLIGSGFAAAPVRGDAGA